MKYAKPEWRNGQPYSPDFNDVYFSEGGGLDETEHVFIEPNCLKARFAERHRAHFVIVETGFGSGLNFLLTVRHWLALSQPEQVLFFYSVEGLPLKPVDLARAHRAWPELGEYAEALQQQYQVASEGFHRFELFEGRVCLILMIGDVEKVLPQLECRVDAWFLDGFAPVRNPSMWSAAVFSQMRRLSYPETTLSSYTAAGEVRRGLAEAGFEVEKIPGHGNKRVMISGRYRAGAGHNSGKLADPPWFSPPDPVDGGKKVSVIGAGIAGLATAWALVKRGYTVEVLEAGEQPGAQASGNPRGLIMPRLSLQDSADAELYASAYFYALRCLQQLDPRQRCWQQTGGLQLASSERIQRQIERYPEDPEDVEALLRVVEPQLASELAGLELTHRAHYFPLAACVEPRQVLQQLIDAMGDSLTIHYQTEVASIRYENGWQCLDTQGNIIHQTDYLVLANAWQCKRFSQLQSLHLNPARGQLSLLRPVEQTQGLKRPIAYEGYLMPAQGGVHIAGASFEMDDCDTGIRDEEHQANLSELNRWLGTTFCTAHLTGGRASVRAVTSDRCPVVGPVPDEIQFTRDYTDLYKGKPENRYPAAVYLKGLFINSGHGARGFTTAFLCAETLAAMIAADPLPVAKRVRYALHPARFLIRTLKKKRT